MDKRDDQGGLWAAPPREPRIVPSWIAPRKERPISRNPLRPGSAPPRSSRNPGISAPPRSTKNPAPAIPAPRQTSRSAPGIPDLTLDAPAGAELRAPRTPTIPPPIITDRCAECDALKAKASDAESALAALKSEMAALRTKVLLESEGELVRLALAVAERVVGRELAIDPALVSNWAREAIAALDGGTDSTRPGADGRLVVAVAPDLGAFVEESDFGAPIVVDPSLASMSAEVRGDPGRADVSAASRLSAVAEALGVETE